MSLPEIREKLAGEQADLVRALAGQATAPDGFDAKLVNIAAASLMNKRLRTVARAWPRLHESLGEEPFRQAFLEFAVDRPLPKSASPYDDGLAFARWHSRDHRLTDAARLELLAAEMMICRIRIARLYESRRRVIALRIPFIGVRRILI
jgi:hypothetical protein